MTLQIDQEKSWFSGTVPQYFTIRPIIGITGPVSGTAYRSSSDYRGSSDRNGSKNNAFYPTICRPQTAELKFIPSDFSQKVRKFDLRLKKFVTRKIPIEVETVVAKALKGRVIWPFVNDLKRWSSNLSYSPCAVTYTPSGSSDEFTDIVIGGLSSFFDESIFSYLPPDSPSHSAESLFDRFSSEIDDTSNQCLIKIFSVLNRQQAQLGADLLELGKTVTLLKDLVTRAGKVILDVKKSDYAKAAKDLFPTSLKQLANDRLSYSFAIKPLIQDIQSTLSVLSTYKSGGVNITAVARKVLQDTVSETSPPTLYSGLNPDWAEMEKIPFTKQTDYEIVVKYHVDYDPIPGLEGALSQLGLTDPVGIWWELVPFSFVVDWFKKLGPVNDALYGLTRATIMAFHRTVIVRENIAVHWDIPENAYWWSNLHSQGGIRYNVENFHLQREKLPIDGNIPIPHSYWTNPLKIWSVDRALNAISLILQRLRR